MIELALKVAASYLLGTVLGSLLLGRASGRADIRELGSGNPGSTNALRAHGKLFALGVLLIDTGKGWVAARIVPEIPLPVAPASSALHEWLPAACGAAVMVGHVYPLWFGFRGGKGVATYLGALLAIVPRLAPAVLLTWIGVVVLTGYVGFGSVAGAAALPVAAGWIGHAGPRPTFTFAIFAFAVILYTHRANIARMRAGREPRARRLWLLARRPPR